MLTQNRFCYTPQVGGGRCGGPFYSRYVVHAKKNLCVLLLILLSCTQRLASVALRKNLPPHKSKSHVFVLNWRGLHAFNTPEPFTLLYINKPYPWLSSMLYAKYRKQTSNDTLTSNCAGKHKTEPLCAQLAPLSVPARSRLHPP